MAASRRACRVCAAPLAQPAVGRPRSYCSAACRQRAYDRRRRRRPRNDWHTPAVIRERVLADYEVTLDAAASSVSALVPDYLGPDHRDPQRRDALAFDHWADLSRNGTVWLNPPYLPSQLLSSFLGRAVATAAAGSSVLALLPASTGAGWWWRHVVEGGGEVEFLRGRLSFDGPHASAGGPAPWASALVLWRPAARGSR